MFWPVFNIAHQSGGLFRLLPPKLYTHLSCVPNHMRPFPGMGDLNRHSPEALPNVPICKSTNIPIYQPEETIELPKFIFSF
jgi:hypothetical protein